MDDMQGILDDKPPILSLPSELLEKIIQKIASKSAIDLVNTKLSCKDLLHASEVSNVWQNVSLDDFPRLLTWRPHETVIHFLQRCRENGNINVIYRNGVQEFCNYSVANVSGLKKLKFAAECGQKQAKYLYGIILLCSTDNEARQGVGHLRDLRMSKCFLEAKRGVFSFVRSFWDPAGWLMRNIIRMCSDSTCRRYVTPSCLRIFLGMFTKRYMM